MSRVPAVLLPILACSALCAAAEWPTWRGPDGGGGVEYDGRLIADPNDARRVWKSEWVPDSDNPMSTGYASPVVADGKVFVFYYLGDGEIIDRESAGKGKKGIDDEALKAKYDSVAADEIMLCLDAGSGETLWKHADPGTGINYQGSGKAGGHFTPSYADGRVAVVDTTGHLRCYDAEAGELLWRTPIPGLERVRELYARILEAGNRAPFSRARGFYPCSAPAIVDDVVCVSNHRGHVGFHLGTGEQLWKVDGSADWSASPLAWRGGGKGYFLGVGNCIEARTGEERWRQKVAHNSGTPGVEGNLLVFGGGGRRDDAAGASGWGITPDGAEKLWQRPSNEIVSGNLTSLGVHRGHAYLHCSHAGGDKNQGYVLCVDARSGEEVSRHDGIWYVKLCTSVTFIGDRCLIVQTNKEFRMFGLGEDFRELGSANDLSGVYSDSTTPALAYGHMYFRGTDAIYCYSLKAEG